MNLLIYVPQMASFGGMERHVCDLARALASRGHGVDLLTTSNSLAAHARRELAAGKVGLRELPRGRGAAGRVLKGAWLLRETLRARVKRWEVIYTNGQSGLARLVWFAGRAPTRIIHHHHTSADPAEQATWSPSFRRVLRRAPEIVACCRSAQQALGAALRRNDVGFLPYLTACVVAAGEVADRACPPGAPLHFGYAGRLVAEKGLDRICALSLEPALADIHWHIHGAGPDYPPARFAPYPRITYHGPYATPDQHAAALRPLDALVLFSRHNEGMPLSLIEGMSAGLPWIATDRGGTPEAAVSPGNCLLVGTRAPTEALVAAVREMARRLRNGLTSRREQRLAYDRAFAPDRVATVWCDFLEAPHPPAAADGHRRPGAHSSRR